MFLPYYDRDGITIYHGDCLEVMKQFPDKSFDLCLTDPPYRNEVDNQPTQDMRNNGGMDGFGDKLTLEQWDAICSKSMSQIIWGANNFNFLPSYKGFLIWQKHIPENFTMSMAEIAYVSANISTISKIFHYPSNAEVRTHPTQKPEALMVWCISKASSPKSILDPFMGSGTTLVAAKKLGRRAVGIEISEKYCEIAVKRIEAIPPNLPFEEESK